MVQSEITTNSNGTGRGFFKDWTANTISHDALASVVVFLVALPLCMGIAIASGAPPQAGIITGIVGGLLVGPLSGCRLQISGPAAGLAVIVFELIREHGIERIGLIIMIGGLVQVVAGFSRCAHWFRAVPPSVVHGMLSGIGVLIFASQFHVMVDDTPKGTGIDNMLSIPMAVWKGVMPSAESTHHVAAMVGLLTIVVLVVWEKVRRGPIKFLPGSLVAIVAATVLAYVYKLPINFVQIPDYLLASIKPLDISMVPQSMNWEVLFDGAAIAFIAAAETLLTATAIDKMHKGERTNYDRELVAQGVGNLTCGFLGGLAMTGVMVRSGVNLSAGAKTRLSAFLHGMWLLLMVSCLPFVVRMIPTSSLAALLVYTGWKLANFKVAFEINKYGRSELAIYLVTILGIVSIDLLTGVLMGIALSIGKLLYIFSHLEIRTADDPQRNRTDIFLRGAATFLSLPRFADALESVRPDTELHVHLEGLDYIDHACLDLMVNWEEQHLAGGGKLVMDWGRVEAAYQDRRRVPRMSGNREFRRTGDMPSKVDEEEISSGIPGEPTTLVLQYADGTVPGGSADSSSQTIDVSASSDASRQAAGHQNGATQSRTGSFEVQSPIQERRKAAEERRKGEEERRKRPRRKHDKES